MLSEFDIYELLDNVRKRPAMYLGNLRSLSSLMAFVRGIVFRGLCKSDPPFYLFGNWLGVRVSEMKGNTMPFEWMEREWGSEKAFDMFFELLDEYRNCKVVCRYRAIITNQKSGFFICYGSYGIEERIEPEKPLEICVAQFAPSDVYYLCEVYFDRHDFYRSSFRKSAIEVRELAQPHWGVSQNDWMEFTDIETELK